MNRRLLSRTGAATFALALLGSVWFFLAPGVLGGSTDYVVTAGISMQPSFHTGDLVLIRASNDYRVGEVVAYHSLMLHTIVLHRIVARDGDRYVFKGDNNNFRDPEHPDRSQLVGRLWLHLPGVGAKLAWLGTPRIIGVLAVLAALLLTGGATSVSRRRKRRRRSSHAGDTTSPARSRRAAGGAAHAGLALASVALVAFGALAALAFTRPLQGPATSVAPYTQAGAFSYSASAPAGPVYPDGHAVTGDPLFLQLIDRVAVRFDYRLSSTSPHTLTGTGTLLAQIASSTGWTHTLQLQPPTPFSGDHTHLAGTLQLRPIQALLRRVEAATAVSGGVTYTLTLQPRVQANGELAGSPLNATFSPTLPFTLVPLQIRPQLTSPATPPSTPDAAAAPNPLEPAASDSIKITTQQAQAFSFRKHHLGVALARTIARIGAAFALVALFVCALLQLRSRHADEPTRIQARYHDWLIPVSRSDRRSYDELVEVTDIKSLIRLAERYDRMILHEKSELGHSYRIADEGVLYVYLIGTSRDTLLSPPPSAEPAANVSQSFRQTTP